MRCFYLMFPNQDAVRLDLASPVTAGSQRERSSHRLLVKAGLSAYRAGRLALLQAPASQLRRTDHRGVIASPHAATDTALGKL